MFWLFVSFEKLRKTLIPEVAPETETVGSVILQPCVLGPFILTRMSMLTSPQLVSVNAIQLFFLNFNDK